ncbi:aldose epimerase family protein [Flavitalea sp. BT771]|uniref:aldose epimerase family protein n=1 Tax=Flavitalea sp. BT771 TaxID=3063329 RepID=UPI0026E3FEE1|nr:aldose epimerase family protein [Flavitalea sp. BT771]MDO6432737.1 aldose epimerase family protein [Flavitalea sp. BT771]MDV6221987.1 aldose epimerase family protein [Flavitalea sp. BT771]
MELTTVSGITKAHFGEADLQPVYLFTLRNLKGDEVRITNYGGIVTSWTSVDRRGNRSSIVAGFETLEGYLARPPFFGALIGRYANRIAGGKFTLDGIAYTLAANKGGNHLHGGNKGFDKVVWEAEVLQGEVPTLALSYLSRDGEEGYPGNLQVGVQYRFNDENELEIVYQATTDKATPVNLTNHSYFNLTGDLSRSVLDHIIQIDADHYTPIDDNTIPTGEIKSVEGSPFDFRSPRKIGERIMETAFGYDHNYVLNGNGQGLRRVATLSDPISGRRLEVFTDQPGMQFYSGNNLDGSFVTSEGKAIGRQCAVCLETQHFPNSPNEPGFPSTILRPGEEFRSVTKYRVSI